MHEQDPAQILIIELWAVTPQYQIVTDQLPPNLSKYFFLEQKTNFSVLGPQFRCESVIYWQLKNCLDHNLGAPSQVWSEELRMLLIQTSRLCWLNISISENTFIMGGKICCASQSQCNNPILFKWGKWQISNQ